MKISLRKNALIGVCLMSLSVGAISGSLKSNNARVSPTVDGIVKIKEIDPIEWYETVRWQSAGSAKELLESGADPDQIFFNEETSLHLAVEQRNYELAELLLAYGADVNIQERKEGFTPLMYAANMDDHNMMQLLVKHGADPTVPDVDGYTTHHYLATRNNQAAAQLLAVTVPLPYGLQAKDRLPVADVTLLSKKSVRVTLAYAEQR